MTQVPQQSTARAEEGSVGDHLLAVDRDEHAGGGAFVTNFQATVVYSEGGMVAGDEAILWEEDVPATAAHPRAGNRNGIALPLGASGDHHQHERRWLGGVRRPFFLYCPSRGSLLGPGRRLKASRRRPARMTSEDRGLGSGMCLCRQHALQQRGLGWWGAAGVLGGRGRSFGGCTWAGGAQRGAAPDAFGTASWIESVARRANNP